MNLPWVSRTRLETANRQVAEAEHRRQEAEIRLIATIGDANQRVAIAQNEIAAVRADNKLLIDRILQLSGQPPIYAPAPVPVEETPSKIKAPKTRVGFDDVHEAAREAIRSGKLNLGAEK